MRQRIVIASGMTWLTLAMILPGTALGEGTNRLNPGSSGPAFNHDAWNDGNAYVNLTHEWNNGLTALASVAYIWLWERDIRAGADQIYMAEKQLTFGIDLDYNF